MRYAIINKQSNLVENVIEINDVNFIDNIIDSNLQFYVESTNVESEDNSTADIGNLYYNNSFYTSSKLYSENIFTKEELETMGMDTSMIVFPTKTIPTVEI